MPLHLFGGVMLKGRKICSLLVFAVVAMSMVFAEGMSEKKFPSRDITVLVPVKAGGDTDQYARVFAQYLQEEMGVGVAVKNVDGASGSVGIREAYNAKPDGYTVLFFHGTALLNEIVGLTDIDTMSFTIASVPVIDKTATLVAPAKKFKDINNFVVRAKNHEKIIASIAQGSYAQLACVLYDDALKARFAYVDSTSAADRIADMLGGRIDLFFSQYGSMKQYVDNGSFITLGLLADERNPFFSEVPTMKEQGIDISMDKFFFFAFPPKTDQAVVDAFNAALAKICADPKMKADFARWFVEPAFMDQQSSVAYMESAKKLYEQYRPQLTGEK